VKIEILNFVLVLTECFFEVMYEKIVFIPMLVITVGFCSIMADVAQAARRSHRPVKVEIGIEPILVVLSCECANSQIAADGSLKNTVLTKITEGGGLDGSGDCASDCMAIGGDVSCSCTTGNCTDDAADTDANWSCQNTH